jgi:hypothetical protein
MVGGACMDGFECGPAEEFLFAGFFCSRPGGFACERYLFLLPGRFVPAGGGCFCFPGGLCLQEVCSFASRIWLVGRTPGEYWRMSWACWPTRSRAGVVRVDVLQIVHLLCFGTYNQHNTHHHHHFHSLFVVRPSTAPARKILSLMPYHDTEMRRPKGHMTAFFHVIAFYPRPSQILIL